MYHRKDGLIVKENDDLMSATRIGVMQIRSAKPPLGAYRGAAPGGGRKRARGVDDDCWGF